MDICKEKLALMYLPKVGRPRVGKTEFRDIATFASTDSYDIFVGVYLTKNEPIHNFVHKTLLRA